MSPAARAKALQEFRVLQHAGDWVWVPQLAWSPDGRFVAATVYAPPNGAERGEDATGFDLWLLSCDASLSVPIARIQACGRFRRGHRLMRTARASSAFGVAQNQVNSERSLYSLYIMDRDGSNRERIFPELENALDGVRVVQFTWSPDVSQLIALREGDLWLYDLALKKWTLLTANGDSKSAWWR